MSEFDPENVERYDSDLRRSAIGMYVRSWHFDQLRAANRSLVERIASYIESDSECLMPIVLEETRHAYGVRLLKAMADEIRRKFPEGVDEKPKK